MRKPGRDEGSPTESCASHACMPSGAAAKRVLPSAFRRWVQAGPGLATGMALYGACLVFLPSTSI